MFNQCPQCRSLISNDEDSNNTEDMVHCNYCGFYFTGAPGVTKITSQITESDAAAERLPPEEPIQEKPHQHERPIAATTTSDNILDLEDTITTKHKPQSTLSLTTWSTIIIVFILLLTGQYIYYNREALAKHAMLRPFLEQLCAVTNCQISARRDLTKVVIVERGVRTHPSIPNALQVSIIINNIANFAQPFPSIQLSFYALDGTIKARRRFDPHEYLANTINIEQGMPSQIPVFANIEIIDPDKSAMNFRFEFF